MNRMFIARDSKSCPSTRVLDRTRLPDHRDLDLAGILELPFDLARDVAREPQRLVVGDAVGLDDDPKLPPRLDSESLLDALEAVRDVLQLLQALDVGLQDLAPRAGPRGRQGVGPVDQDRFERTRLVVAVMALHRVHNVVALAELLQNLA